MIRDTPSVKRRILESRVRLTLSTLRVLAISAVAILTQWNTSTAQDDWSAYGADNRNTKYSPLSGIDASNVKDLKVAWRWLSPDNEIVKANPRLHMNLFEGTPVYLVPAN